jgi:hypothetical protein
MDLYSSLQNFAALLEGHAIPAVFQNYNETANYVSVMHVMSGLENRN